MECEREMTRYPRHRACCLPLRLHLRPHPQHLNADMVHAHLPRLPRFVLLRLPCRPSDLGHRDWLC